jgi:8-oxo-dGTP diphosphatase
MQQVTIAVGVITDEEGRIFLTQRHQPGSFSHQMWQFPGGGVEIGEDPKEAVVREIKEETDFDVEVIRLLPEVVSNYFPESGFQALIICYHCKIISGEFKRVDPETMDGKFYRPEEIDYSKCLPKTKEIIELI